MTIFKRRPWSVKFPLFLLLAAISLSSPALAQEEDPAALPETSSGPDRQIVIPADETAEAVPASAPEVDSTAAPPLAEPADKIFVSDRSADDAEDEAKITLPHFTLSPGLDPAGQLVKLLNDYNFANLFSEILGNRYVSHGCFHLSPACIYILYNVLPKGCTIRIEPYNVAYDKNKLTQVPYLVSLVNNESDLAALKKELANPRDVSIVALPASDKWLLYYKNELFAQFDISAGPAQPMLTYLGRGDDGQPQYDDLVASPTRPGTYRISYFGDYFFAPSYRDTTIIPQGAYIRQRDGEWMFEKNKKWWACPTVVAEDLDKLNVQKPYNYYYYDIVRDAAGKFIEGKWSAHDFGKYVIGWVDENETMAAEVAHTNGVLIKEQLDLVRDLASLLILSANFSEEDFDTLIFRNQRFSIFQRYSAFLEAPDRFKSNQDLVLYKLSRNWLIFPDEESMIDPGIKAALKILDIYESGNFDLSAEENQALIDIAACDYQDNTFVYNIKRIYGITYFLKKYRVAVDKFAFWYDTLLANWPDFLPLARTVNDYFISRNIDNNELKQKILYRTILERTDFRKIDQADLEEIEQEELEKMASGRIYE